MTAEAALAIDYPLFDADQHYYEDVDSFTRHLEPQFSYAFAWATDDSGRRILTMGDKVFRMIKNPTFSPVAKPGALAEYFRGNVTKDADAKTMIGEMEPARPEYRTRGPRVPILDAQHVEGVIMLPTLALGVEELLWDDPLALHAVLRSLNTWIDEEWGYSWQDRIYAAPVFSLVDPVAAEVDLERVIDRGAKVIAFRPAPIQTPAGFRSPADPAHDRFWSICEEAGIVVAYHGADSGYAGYAARWGERSRFGTFSDSAFAETLSLHIERPIFEQIAAMITHGLFDRHPKLRVAAVELGSGWVPELARRLRLAYGKMPGSFRSDPVDALRDHLWVAPFHEDDLSPLADALGADRIMLGSDWPHPEGLAIPARFVEDLASFSAGEQRLIMSDNLRGLLRG
jgi:predicted TIM-barrel fold metal-dependent hydrolase